MPYNCAQGKFYNVLANGAMQNVQNNCIITDTAGFTNDAGSYQVAQYNPSPKPAPLRPYRPKTENLDSVKWFSLIGLADGTLAAYVGGTEKQEQVFTLPWTPPTTDLDNPVVWGNAVFNSGYRDFLFTNTGPYAKDWIVSYKAGTNYVSRKGDGTVYVFGDLPYYNNGNGIPVGGTRWFVSYGLPWEGPSQPIVVVHVLYKDGSIINQGGYVIQPRGQALYSITNFTEIITDTAVFTSVQDTSGAPNATPPLYTGYWGGTSPLLVSESGSTSYSVQSGYDTICTNSGLLWRNLGLDPRDRVAQWPGVMIRNGSPQPTITDSSMWIISQIPADAPTLPNGDPVLNYDGWQDPNNPSAYYFYGAGTFNRLVNNGGIELITVNVYQWEMTTGLPIKPAQEITYNGLLPPEGSVPILPAFYSNPIGYSPINARAIVNYWAEEA